MGSLVFLLGDPLHPRGRGSGLPGPLQRVVVTRNGRLPPRGPSREPGRDDLRFDLVTWRWAEYLPQKLRLLNTQCVSFLIVPHRLDCRAFNVLTLVIDHSIRAKCLL